MTFVNKCFCGLRGEYFCKTSRKFISNPPYNHGLTGCGKKGRKQYFVPDNLKPKAEVLFGINPVLLALKNGRREKFHRLYIKQEAWDIDNDNEGVQIIKEIATERNILISYVKAGVLAALSGQRPNQGVCLDAGKFPVSRFSGDEKQIRDSLSNDRTNLSPYPIWLLLYEIQDPMNVGAILRTAHFMGVDKVILTTEKSCKMNSVVSKASAGAMEVMTLNNLSQGRKSYLSFIQLWKSCGGSVIGTTSSQHPKSESVTEYSFNTPILLIMGNEGYGVEQEILDTCDTLFTITPGTQEANIEYYCIHY
ncbi:rRNA methyltransferase 1, mitochondrial isoform X2 [Patella vulgata]|uniref:rRNA methyltransferase 1, mitochondrial isoform X2 n=1 Tax=Patella vulgata TaxID=6465 RepID=UPI0024A89B21|nr:rRNA methyltransferase 1, mitochondrial isoform X2 [Patella vulgata]